MATAALPRWKALIRTHRIEAALFSAAVFLRLWRLNVKSVWTDEALTLMLAREPLSAIPSLMRTQQQMPLYFWLMHFWIPWFGDPALAIRLFSALCGIATLAVFYLMCRRVPESQARLAFFLGCFSSYWISLAQDGKPYALFALLAVLSAHSALRLLEDWSLRSLGLYVAVGVAGVYTHYYFVLLLAAQFVFLGASLRYRRQALAAWIAAHALILACYAPWLPSLLIQSKTTASTDLLFTEPFDLRQLTHIAGSLVFDVFAVDLFWVGWLRAIGASVILLLAAGLWTFDWKDKSSPGIRAAAFCASSLAAVFLLAKLAELAVRRPMTQARYFACAAPHLYLLIGVILGGRRAWMSALRVCAAVVVSAGVVGYFTCSFYIDPHLAAFSAAVRKISAPEDPVIHLNTYYYLPLRCYYLQDRRHYLLYPNSRWTNWETLPGYPAVMPPEELSAMGRCVFVDPEKKLSPRGFGAAPCASLVDYARQTAP